MGLSSPVRLRFPLSTREFILHATLLLALLAAVVPRVFLRGEVALAGDALYAAKPWSHYMPADHREVENVVAREALMTMVVWNYATERALRRSEWPLWNPYQLTGIPLLANYQSAVLYPPRLLFHVLDLFTAATAYLLLKLWLAGMTAYFCGRSLGLGFPAARFLSIGWMLSGYLITWTTYSVVDVCAWLPLLLVAVEWIVEGRRSAGFYLLCFSGTLMLLAGHPETAFTAAGGAGAYFFLRLAHHARAGIRPWPALSTAALAWTVALLVCAAVIVPLFEYLPNSYTLSKRAAGEAQMQFVRPDAFVSMWVQRFFGFSADGNFWGGRDALDNSNFTGLLYPGVVMWVGIAALVALKGSVSTDRVRTFCLGVPSVLLLLYCFDPPFLRFVRAIPIIGHTWGIHCLPFPMFVLALLGAIGVQRWFEGDRRFAEFLRLAPLFVVAAASVYFVYRFHAPYLRLAGLREYVLRQFALAGVLSVAGLLPLALHHFIRAPRVLANVLAGVLAIDLLIAAHDMVPTCSRARLYPETELTRFLQSQPQPCRVDASPLQEIRPGYLTPYGIETLWGYDGIYPARILRLLEESARPSWKALEPVCAIDLYLHPEGGLDREAVKEGLEWVGTIDGIDVFKNLKALPRVRLVGNLVVLDDTERLFEYCASPSFNPKTTAVTDVPPASGLPDSSDRIQGKATILATSSTKVVIDAEADADCVLVLADAYYPGWKAYVNAKEVEVFPVYHAFRGVVMPAGRHTIEFRMWPNSFASALGVSCAALFASSIVAALHLVRAGRRN